MELKSGTAQETEYLHRMAVGDRQGPGAPNGMNPVAMVYVNSVLFPTLGREKMGLRNSREAQTIAMAVDHLLRGSAAGAMDVLAQRMKARERAISDGNWNTARWFELIPTGDVQLTVQEEAHRAQKLEKLERDLRKGAP